MAVEEFETPAELAFDYQVIRLLGEGAYGKTYLAKDLKTSDFVAIKSLKVVNDFKSLELFRRESEVLESLRVNGVPRFYRSIIPEDTICESCYIIQEYVQYPSIQSELSAGLLFSESETLSIIENIAAILHMLQTHYQPPIIHRDIKPSNVLFKRDHDTVRVFLIDFGSVANPEKRSGGSTIAGTFGYMAPEQLMGECCIQSDFYSLGALALHMLTGVPPYQMESDGFNLHFKDVIAEKAPETSQEMIQLIERLMAVRREERPESARAIMMAVNQVRNGKDPRGAKDEQKASQYVMPSRIKSDTWIKRKGILWRMGFMRNEHELLDEMYEYTFEYEGQLWGGITFARHIQVDAVPKELPAACVVKFDPENPRFNILTNDEFKTCSGDFC